MHGKYLAVGLAGLLLAGSARAGDVVRTSMHDPYNTPTVALKADLDDLNADTLPAFHRGSRGGYYGGYRSYYGGYSNGYYPRYSNGGYYNGGYSNGYYPRYYNGGYYNGYSNGYSNGYYPRYSNGGYYNGGYSNGYYNGCYNGGYYGGYVTYYPRVYYYSPCSVVVSTSTPQVTTVTKGSKLPSPRPSDPPAGSVAPRTATPGKGTFLYDGGPRKPIPMPGAGDSTPMTEPRGPAVAHELLVRYAAPAKTTTPKKGTWVYPAFGEAPTRAGGSSR